VHKIIGTEIAQLVQYPSYKLDDRGIEGVPSWTNNTLSVMTQ